MELSIDAIGKAIDIAKQIELFAIENNITTVSLFVTPSNSQFFDYTNMLLDDISIKKTNGEWRLITREKEQNNGE